MSTVRKLVVDGIEIPTYASLEIAQRYERISASYAARMRSGTRKQRTIWGNKLRTTISGSGVIPVGLSNLTTEAPVVIKCIGHRGILSTSRNIALPAGAWRSDAGSEPYGRALVGEKWVELIGTMVSDTLQLPDTSGATQYEAVYLPELTVFIDAPADDHPQHGPVFAWTLSAEEV